VDFSHVRLHTGRDAAASAQSIGARAYASGSHVVVDEQQCPLDTAAGRQTLAHELVHVVQRVGAASPHGVPAAADAASVSRDETYPRVHQTVLNGLIDIVKKHPTDGPERVEALRALAQSVPDKDRALLISRLGKPPRADAFTDYVRNNFPTTRQTFLDALAPAGAKAPAAEAQPVVVPPPQAGPPASKEGSVFVTNDFNVVKNDPQYLDNFTNDINEAWYPNDRVLILKYPNDVVLKIALQDLVRALDVKSTLNPPPAIPDWLKKRIEEGERSGDLSLAKIPGEGPPQRTTMTVEPPTSFHRDGDSKIIYPQRGKIPKTFLPRLARAVEQIESVRENTELWLKAAPKLLEIITSLEWGAPRGLGALLVSVGRKLKGAGRAVKGLVVKPPAAKPPAHVDVPKPAEKQAAESLTPAPKPAVAEGGALPEPKVLPKGTRPQPPPANLTEKVNPETETLFAGKPELKNALNKAPRAARALKKCTSPCFPEHVSKTQIDRLERMLETAEISNIHYDDQLLTDFLRGKKDWKEFEGALDELEKNLAKKREVLGEFGEAGKQIGGDRVTPEGRPGTVSVRSQPGKATGGEQLPDISGQWFPEVRPPGGGAVPGTRDVRVAQVPGQVARKMRGMDFKNFDDFRETFWKMVANDPVLKQGWSPTNLSRMQEGLAPFAGRSHLGRAEATGGGSNAVYQLNHKQALKNAGDTYNLDNIEVVSPRFHGEIGQ
jgi:hypothetical protein